MLTNLNLDLEKPAIIEETQREWIDSSSPGVDRQLLEREDPESGRATTIVRFAPGSEFPSHVHPAGEEFFVLDGVFSDESGHFSAGTYVRNPVGSRHRPYSTNGATIFVKLGQMDGLDQDYVRVGTATEAWVPGMVHGLSVMPLHQYGAENVALVNWQPGTKFVEHSHPGGEEILVLEGIFEDDHGSYPKGTWLRNPPGSVHAPYSSKGCTIFVKTGHLHNTRSNGA